MPSSESFYLLREFMIEVQYQLQDLPHTISGLWSAVLFPFFTCLAAMALISLFILRLKHILVPRTPAELHMEALYALQRKKSNALALLNTCLQTDPNYIPARLSLAALLLYRLQKPDQALAVLQPVSTHNQAQSILLDVKALKGGCAPSMLQAPLREEEYLSPAFAQAAAAANAKKTK